MSASSKPMKIPVKCSQRTWNCNEVAITLRLNFIWKSKVKDFIKTNEVKDAWVIESTLWRGSRSKLRLFGGYTWMTCCLEADSTRCDTLPSITQALALHKQTHKHTQRNTQPHGPQCRNSHAQTKHTSHKCMLSVDVSCRMKTVSAVCRAAPDCKTSDYIRFIHRIWNIKSPLGSQ